MLLSFSNYSAINSDWNPRFSLAMTYILPFKCKTTRCFNWKILEFYETVGHQHVISCSPTDYDTFLVLIIVYERYNE